MTEFVWFLVGAVTFLALCNVGQYVYWSRLNQKLVDKLMSRNYAEYIQLTKPIAPLPVAIEQFEDPSEEVDILNELNGKFS